MQSYQIQAMEQQIRRRQESLAKMDEDILQELARQDLLEELCGSSASATPRSGLSESSIQGNNESNTSVNSSFLQKEIDRVHQYYRKHQLPQEAEQTHQRTKEINTNRQRFSLPHEQNNITKFGQRNQYSSFFKQTTKHEDLDLQQIRKEYLKAINRQQQQERDKQVKEFLEQKDRIRQSKLQQQRRKIREELIQQQRDIKIKQTAHKTNKKQQSFITSNFADNNCLKIQRTKALSHLLREIQKGKQRTDTLLTKTRTFTHY